MSAKDALRALLPELYAGFEKGDAATWTAHIADDVIGIGTDPDEWWEGGSRLSQAMSAQLREMHELGARLTGSQPRIFGHGEVAWAVDRATLHLGDGSSVPVRITLVASMDGATLRIRHIHFSASVPNEEVVGQQLTI